MKKTLITAACVMATLSALAQGTVNFNNSPSAVGGAGARVFDIDGTTPAAGAAFLAQLYAGPTADSLQPIGAALPFRTGAGAGFVDTASGTTRSIASVGLGAVATIQVRAWAVADGATYEAALAANGKRGVSNIITVTTGGAGEPPALPANLTGLTSFTLIIPEPSTIALGLLGVGALLLRRRK